MYEKLSRLLDLAERVLNLIRPKAYNTIAKLVVFAGLSLIVESQVNFFHALAVALFEEYIGKSEILRNILVATNNPTIGVILVLVGMTYHIIVTLGKDYIDTKKAELPQFPILSCLLLNGDKEELDSEFTIRGCLVNLPNNEALPDYEEPKQDIHDPLFGGSLSRTLMLHSSHFRKRTNIHFYRERYRVLKEWAGAEILHLKIANKSSILANGVSVQMTIPRQKGLYFYTPDSSIPKTPKEEEDELSLSHLITPQVVKIKSTSISSDSKNFTVNWDAGRIQAQTECNASEIFLLKTDKPVEIEYTIFCDELPEPIITKFVVSPSSKSVDVSLDDLVNEQTYNELCDKCIMEGYEGRRAQEFFEMNEMSRQESW